LPTGRKKAFVVSLGAGKLWSVDFGGALGCKSKEGQEMSDEKGLERKQREIEELARGWGKLLAREAFPDGVGLDVDLFTMEELAVTAAKSLVRGAVETMTGDQTETLGTEHACPGCGKLCQLERRWRPIQVRGGPVELAEPAAHCSTCRRDFFPSASGAQDRRARL
jgi:hypothetical protein